MEIARALGQLHGLQIYHVDLNPMNILLRSGHGTPVVRIIDFESAYEAARHAAGVFYNPPNTAGYSAPEIPGQVPDARSDVFSLGAVLYTMLVGYEWTWEAEVGKCVDGDREIDPELRRILLSAVDPDPANRYRSMKAITRISPIIWNRSGRAGPLTSPGNASPRSSPPTPKQLVDSLKP
jgi:serine/threonine protein kinase